MSLRTKFVFVGTRIYAVRQISQNFGQAEGCPYDFPLIFLIIISPMGFFWLRLMAGNGNAPQKQGVTIDKDRREGGN